MLYDITLTMHDKLPYFPGERGFEIFPMKHIETDGANVSYIVSNLHTGTHIDTPIHFVAGGSDAFVPCDMSRRCHEANRNMTRFVSIPGAGHGLSYLVDKETYLKVLREFWNL